MTSFLDKYCVLVAAILLGIACVRVAATHDQLSITFDEPIHFVCGLEYLTKHAYRYETQHPPLERAAGALLPYLDGYRTTGQPTATEEARALIAAGNGHDRLLKRMREGVLPFFAIAGIAVFLWARRYFGGAAAVFAVLVFTSIPPVLAHAGVATTDMALTAFLIGSFYALSRWAEKPSLGWAAALGVCTALSILSKFTTLIYLPGAASLALAAFLAVRRPGRTELARMARERLGTFAAAVGIAVVVIWAGYFFSFGPVPAWHNSLRVPAPELFDGIEAVRDHNKAGHPGYLLGKQSTQGWWYYFPVVLSVKTPIPVMALFLLGVAMLRLRRTVSGWLPLAFVFGVLFPAMMGHINIGVRHVLPLYAGMSIAAAVGMMRLIRWLGGRWLSFTGLAVLAAWLAIPALRAHPDYLAYTNEIAGDQPEEILADSDLDWGQDYRLLADFLRRNGAEHVTLHTYEYGFADLEAVRKLYGLPRILPFVKDVPNEGWNVVSATRIGIDSGWKRHEKWETLRGQLAILNPPWYTRLYPTARIGGLLLFNIPKGYVPN